MKKQPVEKIHVSPIFAQNIDVSTNLIIGVRFLGKVCPKSCIFISIATLHYVAII
jgi:hypothetical protein